MLLSTQAYKYKSSDQSVLRSSERRESNPNRLKQGSFTGNRNSTLKYAQGLDWGNGMGITFKERE